jgi:excisionase family DNA binding protein
MHSDELLTIDELAARLKVQRQTIYSLTRNRAKIDPHPIPHFKIGRVLRFRWSAVAEWLTRLEQVKA